MPLLFEDVPVRTYAAHLPLHVSLIFRSNSLIYKLLLQRQKQAVLFFAKEECSTKWSIRQQIIHMPGNSNKHHNTCIFTQHSYPAHFKQQHA
jgi:hypothetical protein